MLPLWRMAGRLDPVCARKNGNTQPGNQEIRNPGTQEPKNPGTQETRRRGDEELRLAKGKPRSCFGDRGNVETLSWV